MTDLTSFFCPPGLATTQRPTARPPARPPVSAAVQYLDVPADRMTSFKAVAAGLDSLSIAGAVVVDYLVLR
jgi:hypothetical protein